MSEEGAQLVREVMRRVGVESPTDLSKKMGAPWTERDRQRKLYKWHAGESDPNFKGTIALLRVAGMLTDRGLSALPSPPPKPPVDDRLEELRAIVEQQGRATTRALEALEAQLVHITGLLQPPARGANEA